METRTAALAKRLVQYLTFRVGKQDFAMDATRVHALFGADDIDPNTAGSLKNPPWIRGFATMHGCKFPVVDLGKKLNVKPGRSLGRRPCVIAIQLKVRGELRLIGFIADCVSEVVTLPASQSSQNAVQIAGRARRLLNPDEILTEDETSSLCNCSKISA